MFLCYAAFVLSLSFALASATSNPPHILLIVADDFGWSDVGYHGAVMETQNLDQLSGDGITLDNYYVQPMCTPTRAAMMTGKYPIHTGMQHDVIYSSQPFGLPPHVSFLPQRLKEAGYQTHIVGKWHLGFFSEPYLPLNRGFDSFFGFLNGGEDHYSHEVEGFLDFRDGENIVADYEGVYSVHAFMKRAEQIVSEHDPSKPLFLYLPFQNVHSPAQAPDAYIEKYGFISDLERRKYAAMVDIMDEAIGNLTRAFKIASLWSNTLMVFTTDNGGIHSGGGYNWPLRGEKHTLWEGGVRGIGFVNGEMLHTRGFTCKGLMHVTDWYPTLLHAAGLSPEEGLDGVDMWDTIVNGATSPRTEILHNIDIGTEDKSYDGMAIRMGDMKLVMYIRNSTWFKPPEMEAGNINLVPLYSGKTTHEVIPLALYNITADPTEHVDLSQEFPDVVKKLKQRLDEYEKGMVPARNKPDDPEAEETAKRTGAWGPWR